MQSKICGKVWKYGDNINTDIISPAKYMELDYETIGKHAMEGIDPSFSVKISKGDILVAGYNFGSGSSRETAQIALKGAGVGAVIAKSFSRIFFRNSINTGLPVIEFDATDKIEEGDQLEIDLYSGKINNLTKNEVYEISKLPMELLEILSKGGLKNYLKEKYRK
ncbi:MAG: 3-isopropylmalate/(R)-2-methylmalate dehydratase small subunit [Thermoanaerobacteraceae bacterium]|nr:3-isopropylmalate/(R)-2-methylmalate dehydratase small subunit [Thermoanaerobacteraceae bacterium]